MGERTAALFFLQLLNLPLVIATYSADQRLGWAAEWSSLSGQVCGGGAHAGPGLHDQLRGAQPAGRLEED